MKKNISVAKVMVTLIIAVAALTICSCEKDEIVEQSTVLTPTPTRTDVYWLFARDTMRAIVGGDTLIPDQVTVLPKIRAERIYKEEGTNGILPSGELEGSFVANNATSFPYNYGIQNEVFLSQYVTLTVNGVTYENVPAAEQLKVQGWHQVDNVAAAPFHEQSHTTYTLLNSQGEVIFVNGDSVTCQQLFAVREIIPTVVHDTVWQPVIIHDTAWLERYIVVHDTVVNGEWVDSVVIRYRVSALHTHVQTYADAFSAITSTSGTITTRCQNRTDSTFSTKCYIYYSTGVVDSVSQSRTTGSTRNWQRVWNFPISWSGNNPGSGVGYVDANGDATIVTLHVHIGHPTATTNPNGYEPEAQALGCVANKVWVVATATGFQVWGIVSCPAHGNDTTMVAIAMGTTPPPPTVISTNIQWGNCTTANNGVYNPYTEIVNFVVHKSYRWDTVYSDGNHRYSTWQDSTTTYSYTVVRTGQPIMSMINNIPVSIDANNTASFGGGSFTETLTPVGLQAFCPLTLVSATLTSNGTVWSASYGSSTPTVTISETFQVAPPITGKRVIDGWVTYAYQTNTASPEEWGVLYTEDLATGQRYFEYIPWHTGTVLYSEVTNTSSISASDTNSIRSQINSGRYGARVYDHNSTTHQWYKGFTHASQNSGSSSSSTSSWTVTFWLINGVEANHVDLVVGTTDVNSADSRRGHWNGSVLSADNGTLYVSNL